MAHPPGLTPTLAALARLAGADAVGPAGPGGSPEPVVVSDRADATVVRVGGAVAKAHAPGTDVTALAARLRLAAHPALGGVLLPPRTPPPGGPELLPDGRVATVWPHGTPVDPDVPESVPWEAAGRLLARLHAVDVAALPGRVPVLGGPARAASALARLCAAPRTPSSSVPAAARRAVAAVWAGLPAWCRAEAPPPGPGALCHGDFHLGQLVRHPAPDGPWVLIDVDDLGVGDPAWDLARPAAWFAAGLLPGEDFHRLLGAYQAATGADGLRAGRDPWPRLDAPARTLTAQFAARAIVRADAGERALTWEEEALVAACARIVRTYSPGTV